MAVSTVVKRAAVVSLLSELLGDSAGQSPGLSTPPLVRSAQIVPGTTAFCEVSGPVSKMFVGTRFFTL